MTSAGCDARQALVTGASGFVGRHTVARLAIEGYHIDAVDDMSSESAISMSSNDYPERLRVVGSSVSHHTCDARDYFKSCNKTYDLVVHLAAVVGGRLSIENNPIGVATDLAIDAEMFNWAVKTNQRKVVYFSSSAAYPIDLQRRDNHVKLSEGMIKFDGKTIGQPDMSYGWSKLTGEYLAKLAHEKHGLDVVCFRPFSGYGEDQNGVYPFPAILKRVMHATDAISVWGSGEQVRDFIYIDDCIDAMLGIMKSVNDGSAVNLGTGVATSFIDLVSVMVSVVRPDDAGKLAVKLIEAPEGVFYRVADCAVMNSLGARAHTNLAEGVTRAYKFMKRQEC